MKVIFFVTLLFGYSTSTFGQIHLIDSIDLSAISSYPSNGILGIPSYSDTLSSEDKKNYQALNELTCCLEEWQPKLEPLGQTVWKSNSTSYKILFTINESYGTVGGGGLCFYDKFINEGTSKRTSIKALCRAFDKGDYGSNDNSKLIMYFSTDKYIILRLNRQWIGNDTRAHSSTYFLEKVK